MKVAVLSDIHDNIWNLDKVLKEIKGKVKAVIFCGDLCAPFTAGLLGSVGVPTYACLGNVDEDHIMMAKKGGDNIEWTALAPEYGDIKLDKRKIAFCHYPKLAELLAKTGRHDAVFHGHTHNAQKEKYNKSILVNPGAICGIQGGKPGKATYAIYDTKTNSVDILEIK